MLQASEFYEKSPFYRELNKSEPLEVQKSFAWSS